MRELPRAIVVAGLGLLLCLQAGRAELSQSEIGKIGYDQHIGQPISRHLMFQDSEKGAIALGDIFNSKPTLLVLGYYHCPMLCSLINNGMIEAMQELRFNVGRDFNVISVSIDPQETPAVAAAKKAVYLKRYGRPGARTGWHFLTGSKESIAQLANEVGFRFKYDPETQEYAHPSGLLVLTPEGRISRYFFGVNFEPAALRSAMILLCSHYNPITGKYGALVLTVLRIGSLATVLLLGWWIARVSRRSSESEPSAEAS
jgi:protein SCO1/2